MKYFYISLVCLVSAIAVSPSAYANEENPQEVVSERHEAATLLTEPVSINSQWNHGNNLQNTATSISVAQDPQCQSLNPLEFLENPDAIVKKCQELRNNQIPQRTEPVDYLKVPRLDSGLKLTVTKF
ncbi:hypothetical protein [Nostoc sp. CMAA1605]|uniref:hypothetical protein n=1 Tax=Nostoc sp. CMAA1605 TaxID=2055159 RepID=UPI001F159EC7|nr:hypothetical protein [Nostoc sp. CMAA1605]MCF4966558.1 hypothetical protein [Nostoc sp. CMAA1605]